MYTDVLPSGLMTQRMITAAICTLGAHTSPMVASPTR
jgi:hypothetical protein